MEILVLIVVENIGFDSVIGFDWYFQVKFS
jgi:hypothetical protein